MKKTFTIKRETEKKLNLQNSKVSWRKIETIDKKIYCLQLTRLGQRKRLSSIRSQQSFKDEVKLNPIEIKNENDKIQNIFEKFKKNSVEFNLEGLLLSSLVKNDAQKIFLTTSGLFAAKYSLINRILYETIGVINLNEIKKLDSDKKIINMGKC